jgi:hypothetical protein
LNPSSGGERSTDMVVELMEVKEGERKMQSPGKETDDAVASLQLDPTGSGESPTAQRHQAEAA